jgi:hypothetical protein
MAVLTQRIHWMLYVVSHMLSEKDLVGTCTNSMSAFCPSKRSLLENPAPFSSRLANTSAYVSKNIIMKNPVFDNTSKPGITVNTKRLRIGTY